MVFLHKEFIEDTKVKVLNRQGDWDCVYFELQKIANKYINKGPYSVTYTESKAKSGNPHVYYSEAPYWWQNPQDVQGPYIRRDGILNPNRFKKHREDMEDMADAVLFLSLAGYYLNEIEYIKRAVYLIYIWFINDDTKMNPHLEYAQAIKGVCDGRGIGIIDTNKLIQVIHAANYISEFDEFKDEINKLKGWFGDYLNWLNTSKKGLDEKNYFNNHANWWNAQAASFAAFTNNKDILIECFEKYRLDILPNQLDEKGGFKDELTRTRSYHYCLFNLEACALTCEIAYYKGIDLWNYESSDGKSIKKAIEFMLPYIKNPFLWPYDQILGEGFSDQLCLQLGSLRLNCEEYENINKSKRKDYRFIKNSSRLGPLVLLSGFTF